jgi:hypothetical protein
LFSKRLPRWQEIFDLRDKGAIVDFHLAPKRQNWPAIVNRGRKHIDAHARRNSLLDWLLGVVSFRDAANCHKSTLDSIANDFFPGFE